MSLTLDTTSWNTERISAGNKSLQQLGPKNWRSSPKLFLALGWMRVNKFSYLIKQQNAGAQIPSFFFAPSPCKPYFSHCMVICLSNNFLFSLQGQPISSLTHATFLYLSLYQLLLFFFSSTLFPFYTCRRRIGESEKGFIVLP